MREDFRLLQAEVLKPSGERVTAGADALRDTAVGPPAGPAPLFLDLRQAHLTVPSLRPGDTLSLVAEWTTARPLAPNHSWFQYSFTRDAVVNDERLEIDAPATLPLIVHLRPGAPSEVAGGTGVLERGRRVYRWHTSNETVAAAADDQLDELPPPDVRVTTFGSWAAFASWIGPLLTPPADPIVSAKARELTAALADRAAKIEAIYAFVATAVRYVSLSFGIGRFAPRPPAEVLQTLHGDCKDRHALLAALLGAIGVEAVPVLVNTSRSISEEIPSPAEFDHVVTALPSGDDAEAWTWLDTTLEVAPFGLLAEPTRDKRALMTGGHGRPHQLRGVRFDVDAPGTTSLRLPARIRVGCAPDGCAANLQPLREISSPD